ncbi:MAG: RNA 2',3'-cyclic phosphodiesterase [Chloroflexota bacterium]
METIRSFIAIELPEGLKDELIRLVERLRASSSNSVKWVDPRGIHITLKFLGSVSSSRIDGIIKAMEESSNTVSPFQLGVTHLGAFPSLSRPRVVWVGLSGELEKLQALQKSLDEKLSRLSFSPETRPFTPHLTLARLRETATPDEIKALGELIAKTQYEFTTSIKVDALSLMRSQLTRSGAIYSRQALVPLGGKAGL